MAVTSQQILGFLNSKHGLTDAPVNKAAWATYRQALRDVTAQTGFPWTVEWPVAF
jgi:Phage tail assembly chaperone protein